MKTYSLVNPSIEGELKTSFKASSSLEAANEAYSELSQHFANYLPVFYFTLEGGGNLYHFQVEEKISNESANYVLTPFKGSVKESDFSNKLNKFKKQEGGKHKKHHKHDDSSSSSSSSSDYYRKVRVPITSWWYYPNLYIVDDISYYYWPIISSKSVSPSTQVAINMI